MEKKYIYLLLLFIYIFYGCSKNRTVDNGINKILNTDQSVSRFGKTPQSKPFIFYSDSNMLAGRILMAHGNELKPTIIFLHGNPGFEKNEDLGQMLRRGGYNTVFFSYSGTWGNEGDFSYKKSLNDVLSIKKFIIDNSKQYMVDPEQIYLLGFSMGADIAIFGGFNDKDFRGVISIDPWNGYSTLKHKNEKDLASYINELKQRPCIKIASIEKFVSDILNDADLDLKNVLNKYQLPIIHIFSNNTDNVNFQNDCEMQNHNSCHLIESSDHSFSDKRIALATTIFEWLEKNKRK
ncbi:hypothetical protein [Labilibaculum manganireducens]|uniref:alpha/beta hydrolase family protein n=1 Tax=Labilibaculum manganireducens TaxID=1940525 RepID=UPI0029F51D19|nr:hypothetical protein [Labilibaculum manganireducens]